MMRPNSGFRRPRHDRVAALPGRPDPLAVLLGILLVATLQGCLPLWHFDIRGDREDQLPGVRDGFVSSTAEHPVRLLIVHGMGIYPSADYATPLMDGIAKKLDAARTRDCRAIQLALDPALTPPGSPAGPPLLSICDYGDRSGRALRFFVLLWSPLTERVKDDVLGYNAAEPYRRGGVLLNRLLKEDLINASLPDPLLYLSPGFQPVFRLTMRQTLCFVATGLEECASITPPVGRTPDDRDPIFLVTESLASALLYDTLKSIEAEAGLDAAAVSAAAKVTRNTAVHYMLTNQLPLLCLGRFRPGATTCVSDVLVATSSEDAVEALHLVAMSDPNDLLSYPLLRRQVDQLGLRREVTVTNVLLNVERWAWLAIFADPWNAHAGFAGDPDVIGIIACGIANRRPARC